MFNLFAFSGNTHFACFLLQSIFDSNSSHTYCSLFLLITPTALKLVEKNVAVKDNPICSM